MKRFHLLSLFLMVTSSCINPQKVGDPKKTVAAMANTIEKQISDAPQLTIEEFQKSYYQKNTNDFVLVDVREEKETKVSMLPGAITRKEFQENIEKYKGKKIISYCTIGQRSSEYTRSLRKEGFEAYNLKESILGWTHRSLPLVDRKGTETKRVHVYAEPWNLTAKGYKAVWED